MLELVTPGENCLSAGTCFPCWKLPKCWNWIPSVKTAVVIVCLAPFWIWNHVSILTVTAQLIERLNSSIRSSCLFVICKVLAFIRFGVNGSWERRGRGYEERKNRMQPHPHSTIKIHRMGRNFPPLRQFLKPKHFFPAWHPLGNFHQGCQVPALRQFSPGVTSSSTWAVFTGGNKFQHLGSFHRG